MRPKKLGLNGTSILSLVVALLVLAFPALAQQEDNLRIFYPDEQVQIYFHWENDEPLLEIQFLGEGQCAITWNESFRAADQGLVPSNDMIDENSWNEGNCLTTTFEVYPMRWQNPDDDTPRQGVSISQAFLLARGNTGGWLEAIPFDLSSQMQLVSWFGRAREATTMLTDRDGVEVENLPVGAEFVMTGWPQTDLDGQYWWPVLTLASQQTGWIADSAIQFSDSGDQHVRRYDGNTCVGSPSRAVQQDTFSNHFGLDFTSLGIDLEHTDFSIVFNGEVQDFGYHIRDEGFMMISDTWTGLHMGLLHPFWDEVEYWQLIYTCLPPEISDSGAHTAPNLVNALDEWLKHHRLTS